MLEVRTVTRSSAPPEAIFALLADISTWSRWGDWQTAELESPAPDGGGGPGAVRRLTSKTGTYVVTSRERVEEVVPNRRIVYALLSGLPLRDYRGTIELEPDGSGTILRWSSAFEPTLFGTGWFYLWILQRFIADAAARVARAAE